MRLLDADEKGNLKIDPYATTLEPFNKIWKRNKDKNKSIKELAYIFFMENKTNEFNFWHIDDRIERSKEVIKHVFGSKSTWKADKDIQDALEFYRETTKTFAEEFLEDAIVGANKSREFFNIIDWEERDKQGKHIYDITKLNKHLESSSEIIENIKKLQRTVEVEDQESSSRRAGKRKGMFEDME